MKVIVDTIGSSFSIEVELMETVLQIKQKIEKSQGIPISQQLLFLQAEFLEDHCHVFKYDISPNSRLDLHIYPEDVSMKFVKAEESPVKEFRGFQDLLLDSGSELLCNQDSSGVTLHGEDRALTTEQINKIQRYRPAITQETTYDQVSTSMARRNSNESSLQSYTHDQDLPSVTICDRGKRKQMIQTKQSSPSEPVKEIIDIQNKNKITPKKLTVMVQPFKETRKIPVEVNEGDNVEKLRKELDKMQKRSDLNLPESYIFIRKLEEDKPFWWNRVEDGHTIEIFPGFVTNDNDESVNRARPVRRRTPNPKYAH